MDNNDERMTPEEYLMRLQANIKKDAEASDEKEETPKAPKSTEKANKENKKNGSRKKKVRKKKNYLLRFVIFLAVVVGAFFVLHSSLFYVTDFDIIGNKIYTEAQVIELSGIEVGKNMFFDIKVNPARDRLLESPYIRLAKIKRIPMGTIQIDITERVEYAAVPTGVGYVLIDNEGYVLDIRDKEPELPILEGINVLTMEIGSPLKAEQAYLLTDTLQLLKTVEKTDLYFKKINFSTVKVKAYINDNYYCEGAPSEIIGGIDGLRRLIEEQYSQNINKGVITVGSDGYFSFSPKIN